MRQLLKLLIPILCWLAPRASFAGIDASCECPKLSCNPECEVEQSVTFYSEKCDNGNRVKSCARPTCVALPNAPKHCGFAQSQAPQPTAVSKAEDESARLPASAPDSAAVGEFGLIEGAVSKVVNAKKEEVKRGDPVFEGDVIETGDGSKVQVLFKSGNVLNLTPNSVVRIHEMTDHVPDQDKKRAVLDLLKGKIRNRVNYKGYNNDQSYYRVKAGAAVAGVRGTDFVVTFGEEGNDLISRVETLEGKVELSDRAFERKQLVSKNEGATFVFPKAGVKTGIDGYLTPLYKLNASDVARIDEETSFEVAKSSIKSKKISLQKAERPICSEPQGLLNQCVWTCENNPNGEKRCRTDLPNVSCVRRICNANGEWSEPMRLPAAYHERCDASGPVVRPCDY